MPCHDHHHQVTALLCKVCESLERRGLFDVVPDDVRGWWVEHRRLDEERKRRERETNLETERRERDQLARLRAKYGE